MIFYKAEIMSAPLLKVSSQLWEELIYHLRVQGNGARESGAFLLGEKTHWGSEATLFLPYEELQDDALHDDYVALNADSFATLWGICRTNDVTVVADVHTHRYGPGQSYTDRKNPMIAMKGHIGLIIPRFAAGSVRISDVGLHVYQGDHTWVSYFGSSVSQRLLLTEVGETK